MPAPSFDEDELISTINVTPFVDIALVLLIIFMVTANLMLNKSLGIDLPKAEAGTGQAKDSQAVEVYLSKDHVVRVGETEIPLADLNESNIHLLGQTMKEAAIYADATISYQTLVSLIDQLKKVGVEEVSLSLGSK